MRDPKRLETTVTQHEIDGLVVLEPTHDLYEGVECDQMEVALLTMAERGLRIVIDLTHVRHLTARCLGILARAQQLAAWSGGNVALCGATSLQRWLIWKMGMSDILAIYDDVASASRHVGMSPRAVA